MSDWTGCGRSGGRVDPGESVLNESRGRSRACAAVGEVRRFFTSWNGRGLLRWRGCKSRRGSSFGGFCEEPIGEARLWNVSYIGVSQSCRVTYAMVKHTILGSDDCTTVSKC